MASILYSTHPGRTELFSSVDDNLSINVKKILKAFGKTDLTLVIQDCADSKDFSGVGSDKQGLVHGEATPTFSTRERLTMIPLKT